MIVRESAKTFVLSIYMDFTDFLVLLYKKMQFLVVEIALAGAEGFEPSTKVLETLEHTIYCIVLAF